MSWAKDRASRMRKMLDAHAEWKETKNPEALKRRAEAVLEGSVSDTKRCGEHLAAQSWQEGEDNRQRLKRAKFSGWKRKG